MQLSSITTPSIRTEEFIVLFPIWQFGPIIDLSKLSRECILLPSAIIFYFLFLGFSFLSINVGALFLVILNRSFPF